MDGAPIAAPWLLFGALTVGQSAAQEDPSVEHRGRHFRVVLHHGELEPALAESLVAAAQGHLERLGEALTAAIGRFPSELPVVHLYRTAEQYRAVEASQSPLPIATTRPDDAIYNDWATTNGFVGKDGQVHVRMAPALSPGALAEVGVPAPAVSAMFRVATEQVVGREVKTSRPRDFLVALIATGLAEQLVNPTMEYGVDAVFDARRQTIRNRQRFGHTFTLDEVLAVSVRYGDLHELEGGRSTWPCSRSSCTNASRAGSGSCSAGSRAPGTAAANSSSARRRSSTSSGATGARPSRTSRASSTRSRRRGRWSGTCGSPASARCWSARPARTRWS